MVLAVNNFYKKGGCLYLKDDMLGKKIKTLRLERKMTQAELAGETITRNMLSQIENGVAQPSVSTIIDLAKKLDTPIEYFFSENGDLMISKSSARLPRSKSITRRGILQNVSAVWMRWAFPMMKRNICTQRHILPEALRRIERGCFAVQSLFWKPRFLMGSVPFTWMMTSAR
jgi:transcriptional regulator with XRE-family HTH domain